MEKTSSTVTSRLFTGDFFTETPGTRLRLDPDNNPALPKDSEVWSSCSGGPCFLSYDGNNGDLILRADDGYSFRHRGSSELNADRPTPFFASTYWVLRMFPMRKRDGKASQSAPTVAESEN